MSQVPLQRVTAHVYRVILLINNLSPPVGPYSSPVPRDLWWSYGGGGGLMSEVQGHLTHKKQLAPLEGHHMPLDSCTVGS